MGPGGDAKETPVSFCLLLPCTEGSVARVGGCGWSGVGSCSSQISPDLMIQSYEHLLLQFRGEAGVMG